MRLRLKDMNLFNYLFIPWIEMQTKFTHIVSIYISLDFIYTPQFKVCVYVYMIYQNQNQSQENIWSHLLMMFEFELILTFGEDLKE